MGVLYCDYLCFFSTIYAFSTAKTINRGSDTSLVNSLVYVIELETHGFETVSDKGPPHFRGGEKQVVGSLCSKIEIFFITHFASLNLSSYYHCTLSSRRHVVERLAVSA